MGNQSVQPAKTHVCCYVWLSLQKEKGKMKPVTAFSSFFTLISKHLGWNIPHAFTPHYLHQCSERHTNRKSCCGGQRRKTKTGPKQSHITTHISSHTIPIFMWCVMHLKLSLRGFRLGCNILFLAEGKECRNVYCKSGVSKQIMDMFFGSLFHWASWNKPQQSQCRKQQRQGKSPYSRSGSPVRVKAFWDQQ